MIRIAAVLLIGILSAGSYAQDWAELHNKLIRFYGYQRAGLNGEDCANPYYKDESMPHPHSNDSYSGTDLSGGWYDAGDFVKFGLNFGYTIYTLLKGYEAFPDAYDDLDSWDYSGSPDNIPDILNEAKFATDYLIRAVIDENTVVMDVGDGNSDHEDLYESARANWNRIRNRTVKTADGADIPGLYAASLALMSQLYRPYSEEYADSCLQKARIAFQCAVNQQTSGRPGYPGVSTPNGDFYNPDTNSVWADKALAGAIELYKATDEDTYRTWMNTWSKKITTAYDAPNFVSIEPMVRYDLAVLAGSASSGPASTVDWAETMLNDQGIFNNHNDWATCRDAGSMAFMAGLAFYLTGEQKYHDFAEKHVRWVAGLSPFSKSYILGYGDGSSINPHHRNALTKNIKPEGAVVAGPDRNGNFSNSADDYQSTEVAIDYNAGIIGAVAFLRLRANPPGDQVEIQTRMSASEMDVDLNAGGVSISAEFNKSTDWKVLFAGDKSGAKKTITGSGKDVSVYWDGEADKGQFISKENITVRFDMDNIASYHRDRAQTGFYLLAIARKDFKSTDVLVDDFDDNNSQNEIYGNWSIFTDEQVGGEGRTFPSDLADAFENTGLNGSGGIDIRMLGDDGAEHPHVGIKTTFNAAGDPVSLGEAKSIVFDVLGDEGDTFYVELEQPDIAYGEYYRAEVRLHNDEWNRIRIPFSDFEQPEWKTEDKPLFLGAISAVRFTYCGTSNMNFVLDNIHVEDLEIGEAIPVRRQIGNFRKENIVLGRSGQNGTSMILPPSFANKGQQRVKLVSLKGQVLFDNVVYPADNGQLRIDIPKLPGGMYIIRLVNEKASERGKTLKFFVQ